MKAKVTIIVPVYNVKDYLAECLESLIRQTYDGIEILCVDDGSTDGSADILKSYENEKKITVIKKQNGGLSSARNAGLEKCNTKYVMFCDGDDSFDATMCEKMVNAVEQDDSDLAVCGTNIIYSAHGEMEKSDERYYRIRYNGHKRINDEIIINTNVSVSNKIFKMDIINKNKLKFPEGLNNEDFYFYNLYMCYASSITFVNERLFNYERREGSIMSENFDGNTLSLDHLIIAEKLFQQYKKNGYLKNHVDLFWEQWWGSYWFSFEYTSPKLRRQVYDRGRKFVKENLGQFPPSDKELVKNIKRLFRNKIFLVPHKTKTMIEGIYGKVNIGYRQQKYINYNIEQLIDRCSELSQRLDKIEGEINNLK